MVDLSSHSGGRLWSSRVLSQLTVVHVSGFGSNDCHHTPEVVRKITTFFHPFTPGGVYLVAGTPGHWRTSTPDADLDPRFVQVWTESFDAICPWTVGRYGNEEEAGRWGQERVKADAEYLNKLHAEGGQRVEYIPVVLPGGASVLFVPRVSSLIMVR